MTVHWTALNRARGNKSIKYTIAVTRNSREPLLRRTPASSNRQRATAAGISRVKAAKAAAFSTVRNSSGESRMSFCRSENTTTALAAKPGADRCSLAASDRTFCGPRASRSAKEVFVDLR